MGSLVIVRGIVVAIFILIAVIVVIVFFTLFLGFASTTGSFLFLTLFALDLLDLLLIHGRHVFLSHKLQLKLL